MRLVTTDDVRSYAENLVRSLEIFRLPRREAVLDVLRYVQGEQAVIEFNRQPWSIAAYRGMRNRQDVLRHLVFKLHQYCPGGGRYRKTTANDMRRAEQAVALFETYSILQDQLLASGAGLSICKISGDLIEFESSLSESSMGRLVAEERSRVQPPPSLPDEKNLELNRLRHVLAAGRVRILRNSDLEYRVTDPMFELFFSPDSPTLFPANLNLGPYTWGELHLFWLYPKAVAELRRFLLAMTCKELGARTTAYNAGALVFEDAEVRRMKHRVGLSPQVAREILSDLTYSTTTARDVLYQPLIELRRESRVTAPLLLYGSNHERNFLVLVEQLAHRAGASQVMKEVREGLMIEELRPVLESNGFRTRDRLPLGPRHQRVGDIDLLVWNSEASFVLALSLKWLVGPDSVHEVIRHDERFREAVVIHQRCLRELDAQKIDLSRRFQLDPPLRSETVVRGAIISKMAVPTDHVRDASIPIITSDELKAQARDGDLPALYERIVRAAEEVVVRGRSGHREIPLGECRVRLQTFTPESE